mgnify:CR=1 FL=1
MKKLMLMSVAGVLAAVAISVSANDCPSKKGEMGHDKSHHAKGMGMGAMMDTNSDGSISRDEAMSFHTQMFAKIDLNGDGNIDAAEQAKMRDTMREMKHKMKQQ